MSLHPHRYLQILAAALLIMPLSVAQVSAQSDSGDSAQGSQQQSSQDESQTQQRDRGEQSESERQRDRGSERPERQAQQRQQDQADQEESRSGLLERLRSRRENRQQERPEVRDRDRERRDDDRDRYGRRDRDRSRDREQEDQNRNRDERRDSEARRNGSAERQERSPDWQSRRGRQSMQRYRVTPEGWVRIGADYDDDGIYESVETVYILDLDRATQQSRERRQQMREQRRREWRDREGERRDGFRPGQARRQGAGEFGSAARTGDRRSRRGQPRTVEGTIADLQPLKLAGMNSPHLLAKMDTQRYGRIPVCLGPQEDLSQLDLTTGDHVRIEGIKANVNDRPVVFARRVSAGGQSVSVDLPQQRGHRRVDAEIRSTRTANFRRFDEPFLIGQVETRGGQSALVNFGPESEVGKLDLREGDRVQLLVRPGRVNDQRALIAEEIYAGEQHVRVRRPEDRERFRAEDRSRQGDRGERLRRSGRDDRSERDRENRSERDRDDRPRRSGRAENSSQRNI